MKPPTIQLFLTPAPAFRVRARADALCGALRAVGADVILTQGGFDPLAIDEAADQVCAVGGDGTLRHVIEAVRKLDRRVSVSVYPAGTVNLVAMEYAYPRSLPAFARRLLSGAEGMRHVASVNGLPLLACASVGPDSRAVEAVSPVLKRWFGRYAYVLAFLHVLVRWPRAKLVLHHDGQQTQCEAVYIAKGPFFAGRWSIAPQARGVDPSLHVVALPEASRWQFLCFTWAVLRRRAQGLVRPYCFVCSELTITGEAGIPLQSDGDVLSGLPATIRIDGVPIRFVGTSPT
jgi:diacylglycerol kinase family enzyme